MNPHLLKAYESLKDRAPGLTLDDFLKMAEGWDVHPVDVAGEPVGAVMLCGPEVHACIVPKARGLWCSKRMLRLLDEVIERHGHALTRVGRGSSEGHEFVSRLGFVAFGGGGTGAVYYRKVKNGT